MSGSWTSVQVLPGPGVVARFGDVLLWLEEGEAGGRSVTGGVLDVARALAEGGDARQAGVQLADVLRSDPPAVPALVLVAPTAEGLQVVVHGWGRLLADGVDIDGGWADRQLAWTTALAAGRGGDLLRVPTPGSVLDLRRGSTPGGGAAVALVGRDATPSALVSAPPALPASPGPADPEPDVGAFPAPAPPSRPIGPAPAFEPIDLRSPPVRRDPLPVGDIAPVSGVTVQGVTCSRGHFNNPIALLCAICGISMDRGSRILQDGLRPSLGTLVLDDGTAFGLDADHLIGTAPQHDPAVGPSVRPVIVADPSGHVAAVHAEVRLVGWDAVLVARAPTFVLAAGSQQWIAAPPGQPATLTAGTRVAIGQRTFVVESNARSSAT